MSDDTKYGKLFWILLPLGGALMLFGMYGIFHQASETDPPVLLSYLLGLTLIHDGLIVPAVCGLGLLLAKRTAGHLRAFLQVALVLTGVIALFSVPFVAGFGRLRDNPSLLPSNYAAGLAISLAAVWIATIAVMALSWKRARP